MRGMRPSSSRGLRDGSTDTMQAEKGEDMEAIR